MDGSTKAVLEFITAHAAEQIDFLVELCEENSFTRNKAGVDAVGAMILRRLGGLLQHRRRVENAELGDHLVLRNTPDEPAVTLVGHMDTVFPPSHLFQRCRRDGDVLIGPGTQDMKGGIAVIVYALKALAAAGLLDCLRVAVIFNSDEEIGSVSSRDLFLVEAERATICLVAECGGPAGEIVVSRNGKMGARVACTGRDRHVAVTDQAKASAILELAHRIIALESLNGRIPGTSCNVGGVEGGLGAATVPCSASCLVDFRWLREKQSDLMLEGVHQALAGHIQPGCTTKLEILNTRPAMARSTVSDELFAVVAKVARGLGQEIRPEHRHGTSDANFFASRGVPTLDGLGPVGEGDHTAREHIHVKSLAQRTSLLALSLVALRDELQRPQGK